MVDRLSCMAWRVHAQTQSMRDIFVSNMYGVPNTVPGQNMWRGGTCVCSSGEREIDSVVSWACTCD